MFSEKELVFIAEEVKRFSERVESRLHSQNFEKRQRKYLEERLVTAYSIQKKLTFQNQSETASPKTTPSVLLIDDAESTLITHKEILSNLGFSNIDTAINGKDGLKMMKEAHQNQQAYGLVICDWEMPKLSGFALLEIIRADNYLKNTPFFLVTARNRRSDMIQAMNLGVTGYIIKPVSPAVLEEKLHNYIVKRSVDNQYRGIPSV